MNTDRFNEIVEQRCTKIQQVLITKAKEYATEEDRLHNFNRAAQISGKTRERALDGMMLKHVVSYQDILDRLDKGTLPSIGVIDEKFGDYINYLILMEACIIDRIDSSNNSH